MTLACEYKRRLLLLTSFSQVDEILDNMDLITIRMTRLRTLRNHMSATIIEVDPPDAADKKKLNDAFKALGQHIKKDQKWTAVRGIVRKILAAAGTIKKNVEGRQHKDNA